MVRPELYASMIDLLSAGRPRPAGGPPTLTRVEVRFGFGGAPAAPPFGALFAGHAKPGRLASGQAPPDFGHRQALIDIHPDDLVGVVRPHVRRRFTRLDPH